MLSKSSDTFRHLLLIAYSVRISAYFLDREYPMICFIFYRSQF